MDDKNVITVKPADSVGQVQIADDVIAVIAEVAATEVDGVAGTGGNLKHDIVQTLTRNRTPVGVKVEVHNRQVMLYMTLIVEYGAKIPVVTVEVQKRVKSSIETMTGLEIVSVDIHVTGIHFEKTSSKGKSKKSES